jgi:hypothetical protein
MSLRKARDLGCEVRLLPYWHDLDTFDDLLRFYDRYKDRPVFGDAGGGEAFEFLSRLEQVGGSRRLLPAC